jgi:hypothetical protein
MTAAAALCISPCFFIYSDSLLPSFLFLAKVRSAAAAAAAFMSSDTLRAEREDVGAGKLC